MTVRATDDGSPSLSDAKTFTIHVNAATPANQPPSLAAIPNQTVAQGSTVTLIVTATDPDVGQTLTYSLDPGAPSGATIDAKTGAFTWAVPAAQAPSDYPVTVRATDDGSPSLSDAKTFTIHVNAATPANQPPSLAAIPNQTVAQGSTVTLIVTATDPDVGQTLTYSLDPGAPSGATIDAKTGAFTWAVPAAQAPSDYPVTVRATDDGSPSLSDAKTFTIHVNAATPANQPPSLAAIPNQTVAQGSTVTLIVTATDPDVGQTLTYSLDPGAPSGATIDAKTGAFTWAVPAAQAPSDYPVTVRATDDGSPSLSDAKTFTIHVNAAPTPTPPPVQVLTPYQRNAIFARALYRNILGHDPNQANLTSWVNRLLAGTSSGQMATTLWNSAEHRTLVRSHKAPALSYNSALSFALQASQPMSMGHQDTVFVTTFCRDVLGHNPTPAVLNSWVKRMLAGTSQNQVATAIWNSAEHRTLVKRHRAPQTSYSSALADASQAANNA